MADVHGAQISKQAQAAHRGHGAQPVRGQGADLYLQLLQLPACLQSIGKRLAGISATLPGGGRNAQLADVVALLPQSVCRRIQRFHAVQVGQVHLPQQLRAAGRRRKALAGQRHTLPAAEQWRDAGGGGAAAEPSSSRSWQQESPAAEDPSNACSLSLLQQLCRLHVELHAPLAGAPLLELQQAQAAHEHRIGQAVDRHNL